MFWRFGFNNPSAIDGLLEQEDITLDQILNDPDVIQEAKSQNPKLIEFLLKKENLTRLVTLFFQLYDEEATPEKQRLPILACEVLGCEIPQLIDAIVIEHTDVLQDFWNFLDLPHSIKPSYSLQSSYFCKIITIFLTKRTLETLDFIKSTPENLKKILSHLESSAVMDLLMTLVRLEELPEAKGMVQWLNDNGLLLNLVNRLDPNLDTNEHCTAQQGICEIVRMSQTSLLESPSIGMNDFIVQLTSKEIMQKLVDFMLDPIAPNSTSTLINGVTIIIDIIRHNNSDMDNEAAVVMGYGNVALRQSTISLVDMLQVLVDNIERFNHLLLNPKSVPELTIRASLPVPLGFERLKICELFAELLHCSNMSSLNVIPEDATDKVKPTTGDLLKLAFVEHHVLPTCTDLFFYFAWNNFLHYVVYDMLHQVFNGQMGKESNRQLALSIFTQGHLTDKIVEAQEKNDIECAKPKGMRLGYMGHLTFISDEIIKLFEGYPEGIIASVKDDIDLDKWHAYCARQLKETKERDNLPLGEVRHGGMHAIVDDDDDDEEDEEEDEDDDKLDDEEDEENAENTLREQANRFSQDNYNVDDPFSIKDNSAGLEVFVDHSDEEEETQDYNSSEDEQEHHENDWPESFQKRIQDEEEDDPFGDRNSSTNQDDTWEQGFSSDFSKMTVNTTPEKEQSKSPVKA